MKALLIGGTGIMSTEVAALALEQGIEVYEVNRGSHPELQIEDPKFDARCDAVIRAWEAFGK